ncbi:hypothetical protein JOF56_009141 [Kibdelosporangium banguiense]|uniref:Secreted protein n=1 Tax=Kibdelosporangium banguiense TaxID=1365924 RepID=A0ABS4TWG7_9PSEU|nr:hypothetical protein [Kibdelosporangium banguiense]
MTRSQWAFIFGAWGVLVRMFMSSAWKTASEAAEYFVSRSRSRKRNVPVSVPRSVARLRACCVVPVLGRVFGDAGDVQPSCAVFEEDRGVEACVDVEEVCRDDAAGLAGEELFPGGAGSVWGGIDAC